MYNNLLAELIRVYNMFEKFRISLIFINLVLPRSLSLNHRMHNLYTKFVRILEICKQFSHNLVNAEGNIVRRGPVPRFSDLEVVALSLAAESESIDSENWLFEYKLQEYKEKIPNLISRRQFNDRRKKTAGLCETIRKRIALKIDGGEDFFLVDSKPIEVCRPARGKRCKMGQSGDFSKAPDFGYCASQNTYYFGYKLHAVCGLSGVIHSYDLSKASAHDLNYMKDVKLEYVPYGWQFKDEDVFVPARKAARLNLFGFISRNNEYHGFTAQENITQDKIVSYLDEFSKSITQKTVLVLDNASVHRGRKVKEKREEWAERGLFVFYLPPYSPQLNIAETLWRILKGKWIKPQAYQNAQILFDTTNRILEGIGKDYIVNFSHVA